MTGNNSYGRKSVAITGCTSGLGRSLFRRFASAGWIVTGCGRRVDLLESLKDELGGDAMPVPCDIRLENHVAFFKRAIAGHPGYLDVLVLNAGTIGQLPLPRFAETNLMELRKTFETNVFANFNLVANLLPLIRSGGLIVHITSDASLTPYAGWSGYGSSKAAFSLAIKVLDEEIRHTGLRAVNIDPGDMDTEMHRLAIPDSDRSLLKSPDEAAAEVFKNITELLGGK